MSKKKVTIIVEQAKDGSFWCHTKENIGKVGLSACGASVEDAKKDLMDCLALAKEDAEDNGKTFPEVEFEYKYDLQSFFNYFSLFKLYSSYFLSYKSCFVFKWNSIDLCFYLRTILFLMLF